MSTQQKKKKLLSLSKVQLIKRCKEQKVSILGCKTKNDYIQRLLKHENNTSQNKIKKKKKKKVKKQLTNDKINKTNLIDDNKKFQKLEKIYEIPLELKRQITNPEITKSYPNDSNDIKEKNDGEIIHILPKLQKQLTNPETLNDHENESKYEEIIKKDWMITAELTKNAKPIVYDELILEVLKSKNWITNNKMPMNTILIFGFFRTFTPEKYIPHIIAEEICRFYIRPIIIDQGEFTIKAGFGGCKLPQKTFRPCVGRTGQNHILNFKVGDEVFSGNHGGICITNPIYKWDCNDMAKIWNHTFDEILKTNPENVNILLAANSDFSYSKRRLLETAQIMFEYYNVNGLYVADTAELSLHAIGKLNGSVIDFGHSGTRVTGIYDGHKVVETFRKCVVGGKYLTNHLQGIIEWENIGYIKQADYRQGPFFNKQKKGNIKLTFEIANRVKEMFCYMTPTKIRNDNDWIHREIRDDIKPEKNSDSNEINYELPDGKVIKLNKNRSEISEYLLCPAPWPVPAGRDKGIIEILVEGIKNCNNVEMENEMFNNVLLCGATAKLNGLKKRIEWELAEDRWGKVENFNVISPPNKEYLAWIGGSMLSSSAKFETMIVSKSDYEEHGAYFVTSRFRNIWDSSFLGVAIQRPASNKTPLAPLAPLRGV